MDLKKSFYYLGNLFLGIMAVLYIFNIKLTDNRSLEIVIGLLMMMSLGYIFWYKKE